MKVVKKQEDIGRLKQHEEDGKWVRDNHIIDVWKFLCPGCGFNHSFWMDGRWNFDGNVDNPTFTPSLLLRTEDGWKFQCHSIVTGGKIQFLSDCTHPLAGQTVNMSEMSE